MINYVWALMIIVGVIAGVISGQPGELVEAILGSSSEAVTLIIGMIGIMSLWNGLIKVADAAGITEWLTRKLSGVIRYLYPSVPKDSECAKNLTLNLVANFLGLGYAATPSGLAAMKELIRLRDERLRKIDKLADKKAYPSNDMCTFLILHVCSMQLIPVNLIAYRNQYGSINPGAVVGYGMVTSTICLLVAILYSKICAAIYKDK